MRRIIDGIPDLDAAKRGYFDILNPTTRTGYHRSQSVVGRLEKLIENERRNKKLLNFIRSNIRGFLLGTPQTLLELDRKLQRKAWKEYPKRPKLLYEQGFQNKIRSVFNYTTFRSSQKAVAFVNSLQLRVCPYCNEEYLPIVNRNGKTQLLFDLDHYFPKADYPWFSLSFFNLVPACKTCNGPLKLKSEMRLGRNLHPYTDTFDNLFSFRTHIPDVKFFGTSTSDFHIHLVPNIINSPSRGLIRKGKRNAKIFALMNRLNQHKDIVREFVKKRQIYSDGYLEELYSRNLGLFKNRREVVELVLGNHVNPENINDRPLAKLYKDLAYEFSLNEFWE